MRRYESVIILDPDLPDEEIVGLTDRFSNVIKTNGGEIIKIEDWGAKRLAYLVKKKDKGRYILFDYVGSPALIREIERQLKITEDVMKFLSVKLDEEVDLEAFKPTAAQEETAVAEVAEMPVPGAEPEVPAEAGGLAAAPEPAGTEIMPPTAGDEPVSFAEPSEAQPEQEPAEPTAQEEATSLETKNEEV
jgi:small subunit ribosomal protein S6